MVEIRHSQETIVVEALRLLNEEGLEGVSLRRLADRLGIKAPSLYHHFADKSALLAAVVERIFDQGMSLVPERGHWQEWMRAFGQAMWKTQRETRDFCRLIGTTDISGDQINRTIGKIRRAVAGLDMDPDEAMRIQSGIQALVLGWSVFSHASYAEELGRTLDFDELVMDNLELLIAGEALKLERQRQPASA
jgi:TetR/AcrR family tetracycline transcriptional repressor